MKRLSFLVLFFVACSTDPVDSPVDQGLDLTASDLGKDLNQDRSTEDIQDFDMQPDVGDDAGAECLQVVPSIDDEGQRLDGWTWEKGGRVFQQDPDVVNAKQGDFSPSVVKTDRGYRLYFSRKRLSGWTIWTSQSEDGLSWGDPVEVQGLDGQNVLSANYKDGETRLWFGSGSFDTAKSVDGVNFTNQITRIIKTTDLESLNAISMLDPKVYLDGSEYKMWFTFFDGVNLRVTNANSSDGILWNTDQKVVLEGTNGTAFDSKSVGSPLVRKYGQTYYMWYSGYDTSKTDPGPWRVGLATSSDAINWERQGVSIPLSETGDDMWSTRDASVFVNGLGELSMVYVGMSDDSHYRLLSAKSGNCFK